MLACGERGYGDGSTPCVWLSSIALLPWLPGFPPPVFSHHDLLPLLLLLSRFSCVQLCVTCRQQLTRLLCPWDSPGKNTGVGCHFLLQWMEVKSESEVTQSCLTLSYPMDRSLPGSSVHGIFQARVLEWGAIAFSGSPPSHPFNLFLHSQQQPLPWDCSTIPKLQLPAAPPSRGPMFLSGICMAAARTVWFSFCLGCHRSAVSLSALNVSSNVRQLPWCGDQTPVSIPLPAEGRFSLTNTTVFPLVPSSYQVFVVLHILFHWSGTPAHSQLMLCMHFCVIKYIPDLSVERDVLHVHLLLHHLVLSGTYKF